MNTIATLPPRRFIWIAKILGIGPYASELRALLRILYRSHPRLAMAWWGFIAVNSLLPIALTLSIGWIVESAMKGKIEPESLALLGFVFIALNMLSTLGEAVSGSLGARASEWCHRQLLQACLAPQSISHLEQPGLMADLSAARDFDLGIAGAPLAVSLPRVSGRLVAIGTGLFHAPLLLAMGWYAPLILIPAWLLTSVMLGVSSRWSPHFSQAVMLIQQRTRYFYQLLVDTPAAKEVRLFGLGEWLADAFRKLRLQLFEQSWKEQTLKWSGMGASVLLVLAANAAVIAAMVRPSSGLDMTPAQLTTALLALAAIVNIGFQDDYFLRTALQPMPRILRMIETMRREGNLDDGDMPAADLPRHEIRLENVGFHYPGDDKAILDGFTLVIPAGKSMAIVGQNGAGKTTLIKLLARLYDPTAGRILVDGKDLRDFDIESWRSRLAIAYQDFVRYPWTLHDNVAAESGDDALIERALSLAEASDVASPDAILMRGVENGVDLSGGQWQRVCLARVIARHSAANAGLVVLDEPTEHLDVRAEEHTFNRLLEAMRGTTTLLISHRFSTVRKADLICVIEQGRVRELGNHEDLMRLNGLYRHMFDLQASRFDEDC
ncbi:MAG: ABC transporter ATP-binding protein [Pseudomonadota bacterium]